MQEQSIKYYKLNQKIKDDKFNIDFIPQYNLSLQISNLLFRICITDTENNRCLFLEDYQLNNISNIDLLTKTLEEIYDDHHLLQAGFWKSIKIGIKNFHFSLIPNTLFDIAYLTDYLSVNSKNEVLDKEEIYYYKQDSTDAVNVFSANKKLAQWFIKAYPTKKIQFIHHTSPFIEGVMFNTSNNEGKSLYILIENNSMTLMVKNNKTLEFCNCFNFTNVDDFIYFIMFVFEQLNLNPERNEVILFGEINPDSTMLHKLKKYVKHIRFGTKPSNISFGYQFDEVFDHRFFDLYNMHICEYK